MFFGTIRHTPCIHNPDLRMSQEASMDRTVSFGRWVKQRRVALDLTQGDLARLVGCARVTIQKIEADERRPSRQIAERLADQLQLVGAERAALIAAARTPASTIDLTALRLPSSDIPASAALHRSNLPAQLTPLVGREHAVEHVSGLLL